MIRLSIYIAKNDNNYVKTDVEVQKKIDGNVRTEVCQAENRKFARVIHICRVVLYKDKIISYVKVKVFCLNLNFNLFCINNKISFNSPAEEYTKVSHSFCDARIFHCGTCEYL